MKNYFDTPAHPDKSKVETGTLQLSTIYTGTSHTDNLKTVVYPFSEELFSKLELFSEQQDSTLFITLITAFRILLYKYNNEESISVWNVSNGYSLPEAGLLTMQNEIKGAACFTSLMHESKNIISDKNAQTSNYKETTCRQLFVLHQTEPLPWEFTSVQINEEDLPLDLIFTVSDSWKPGIIVKFSQKLYNPEIINQMIVHFDKLLNSILKYPDENIGSLPMLTEIEEHELLNVFNDTLQPYPSETIVDLFEQQALKTPANIALYMNEESMSYEVLNKRANQLAAYLIYRGVKKEDNIGLLTTRGFGMIISMYAILKAGAAYVPIEAQYPADRQKYMLSQSSVTFILSDIDHPLNELSAEFTVIDIHAIQYDKYSGDNPGIDINGRQLAYTIYTSGSTGVPKGVMIEHHSVTNLITWVNREFNICEHDRLLFVNSICFDLSVYDIFGMLVTGGSIVIAERKDVLDTPKLAKLLKRFHITFWNSVPTILDYLVSRLAAGDPNYRQNTLRLVFLSGDWIPVSLPEKAKTYFPNAHLISLGGATEGTVWSNYYPISNVKTEWHSIPYGKPISNNAFYILNEYLQPVPPGVIGELYIGGAGIARGYANNQEKTQQAFLPDPFTSKWGGKMYRTGDLGRMLPDMTMEFIGRKDNQVKIRGHRIELSEIEYVLRQCSAVDNAIVLYFKERKQLVGYIVPGKYYDHNNVIAQLRSKLPDYMIPVKWVEIDSIPLTANGKTDTNALLDLAIINKLKSDFVAPRDELENTLAAIWQRILEITDVGINNNFFELGGQSLLAVELITEIEKSTGTALPINIVYKCPTIAEMAAFLKSENGKQKWKSLVAVKPSGNKMPVYIVHGDGLSISNFHNLSEYVDNNQPVFSLQPLGLNGAEDTPESIPEIAKYYVSEILEHNPTGPYALAGYSFGGYVAIEMKKQLEAMDKNVKMLAIFDTDAENVTYKKSWITSLPKRIKRQIPKFLFIVKSMFNEPIVTIKYQYLFLSKKINNLCYTLGIKEKPSLAGVNKNIDRINEAHLKAFRNYQLTPFNDKIYLFKAKTRIYFVDDFEYLGWTNYAKKGVSVCEVPGDHRTMFNPPNVSELARSLQCVLDNC